ncbi:MAG: uroporphyrinogen decarboxylase family protein [Ignavibacteria bacterium]
MTSRERVLLAMNFEYPDRVPVMCQMSIGHMLQQLKDISPVDFWFDAETFANGLICLRELYQFDGILVSLHGHFKTWKEIYNQREIKEDREIVYLDDRKLIFTDEDLPFPEFYEERKYPSIDEIDVSSLPKEIDYIPVSGGLHFKIDLNNKFEIFDLIYQKVGDEFSIHGEVTSPFDYLLDLWGYENALMSLIENQDKCKQILQHFTNGISKLASEMCDKQIDAIKISSPFAGAGFISPEFYKEFVLPYESQIISAIKSKGKFAYLHTCGAINDRLELMIESGTSGLECLDPKPLGDVDLVDAKRRLGTKVFIKGNIDSVNTLLFGKPRKIIVDVSEIVLTGKVNGGFILSTACSIAPKVPAENIKLLKDLAEEFGKYYRTIF